MYETIKEWLRAMYTDEIKSAQFARSNEHIWEIGYDGKEPNPHTENIEQLEEYIEVLEELKEKLK